MTARRPGLLDRLVRGVRDTLRLMAPSVRAERAYTFGRERLIRDACARAGAGAGDWLVAPPGGAGYGAGFDERVVEYPWVIERLGSGARLLDVGSALNHEPLIALVLARYGQMVFLNPFRDDGHRSRAAGARYVRADARMPGLRGGIELVTCVSTLEHVGCDNRRYGGPAVDPGTGDGGTAAARRAAVRAMRSLLRPGGRLLLTVPFGRAEDHGWLVQFDEAVLADVTDAFAPAAASAAWFRYQAGWHRAASAAECADARYGALTRGAGAVACLELTA